jgi:hypothetical protein
MYSISIFLMLLVPLPQAVPVGTRVEARLESTIKTGSSAPGESVIASLVKPIRLANQTIVPAGSRLSGRIETIEAGSQSSPGRVRLVFREIDLKDGRRAATWITESYSAPPPRRGRRYLLSMGLGGAAGALIGGTAARVSGILGGALIGFIVASNTGGANLPDLTLPSGRVLHLQVGEETIVGP